MSEAERARFPFRQVDVFTAVPFKGNPVAVILDGDGLTAAQMQSIANWTNLSETTFVCAPTRPEADYLLRIFTPRSELPFAGHPTLGSAWAVLQHGLMPKTPGRLLQECAKGLITVRLDGASLSFALPEPTFTRLAAGEVAAVAAALGIPGEAILRSAIVDVGPVWLTLQLRSAREVIGLAPNMQLLAAASARCTGVTVFGLWEPGGSSALEVRSFTPADGLPEDPVCGSGNGCVAAIVRRHALLGAPRYVATQGRAMGREGRVEVELATDGTIWLGGRVVTCVEGKIAI